MVCWGKNTGNRGGDLCNFLLNRSAKHRTVADFRITLGLCLKALKNEDVLGGLCSLATQEVISEKKEEVRM